MAIHNRYGEREAGYKQAAPLNFDKTGHLKQEAVRERAVARPQVPRNMRAILIARIEAYFQKLFGPQS